MNSFVCFSVSELMSNLGLVQIYQFCAENETPCGPLLSGGCAQYVLLHQPVPMVTRPEVSSCCRRVEPLLVNSRRRIHAARRGPGFSHDGEGEPAQPALRREQAPTGEAGRTPCAVGLRRVSRPQRALGTAPPTMAEELLRCSRRGGPHPAERVSGPASPRGIKV